jgi:hypothetical protein
MKMADPFTLREYTSVATLILAVMMSMEFFTSETYQYTGNIGCYQEKLNLKQAFARVN